MKRISIALLIFAFTISFVTLPAVAQSSSAVSFEKWLEKYGAWDRLENEYAQEQGADTPEMILKRAEVYLNLNSPQKALEIVEMTPAFDDNATEADRLWLGGQSHRALGDLSKSVLWFSQASSYMVNDSNMKRRFKDESGLENIWMDVWLKLYWSFAANQTVSKSSQGEVLKRIQEIGQKVYGGSYWEKANLVLNPTVSSETLTNTSTPDLGPDGQPLPPFISRKDTELIAQALASVSLEKFEEASTLVASISHEPVRFFWSSVVNFFQSGNAPTDLSLFIDGNYLKAYAFWNGNVLAPYSTSNSKWVLGNPDSGPWTKFRNNLLSMPIDDAVKAINNELGSMLISEQTAALLNNFKLALSMSSGDFINSATAWNSLEKRSLPLALKLAGALLFKDDFKKIMPVNTAEAFAVFPILVDLSGAAGNNVNPTNEAGFWISASQSKIKSLSKNEFPLDKLLLLAYWQQEFTKKPTAELAKRSAFLLDDTAYGVESMLYLANQAVRNKKLQLGAFYLNAIDREALSSQHEMAWLDIKARLELDSGRNAAALETFKLMTASEVDVPVMTRLRMALLYQQNRDFDAAREQLMSMWDNRANMTTTLQAETLFWLGEGEQAVHNKDKALDYYLKLAWQYPQENIWALTAMYRASLIYEKRGKYDTAKRLLTTVIKRADRKEQREAAKARIAAIDKKMGQVDSKKKSNTLVYPF